PIGSGRPPRSQRCRLPSEKAAGFRTPGAGQRALDRLLQLTHTPAVKLPRLALFVPLALAFIGPLTAAAAETIPKVTLLFVGTPEAEISGPNPTSPSARGFLEGMRELGWVDGQNIVVERRSAKGDPDRYLPLIHEMISLKVDVIVISGAPQFVI